MRRPSRRRTATHRSPTALLTILAVTMSVTLAAPTVGAAAAPATVEAVGSAPGYGLRELPLVEQPQQLAVWCVPAAARALLSSYRSALPSQLRLALQTRTGLQGTYLSRLPTVLSRYETRTRYGYSHLTGPAALRDLLVRRLGPDRAPVIAAVAAAHLPWYEGVAADGTVHALVVHGYLLLPRVALFSVWDPADLPQAGDHLIGLDVLWAAMQPVGAPVVG